MTNLATASRPRSFFRPFAQRASATVAWGFPEIFIISQTVLPGLLYLPGTQLIRVPIRVAAYGMSLGALFLWASAQRSTTAKHPSRNWLIAAVAYLVLMIAHPETNSIVAGVAQAMLYLAVLAPVFWAPHMVKSPAHLRRLLAMLLICNGINSLVGVLQVFDPDRWMPKELTTALADPSSSLSYLDNNGKRIVRPPGLSDAPGAVCGPAVAAGVLGLAFCANAGLAYWKRAGALAFAFAGVSAIYLSHVRSSLIVLAVSIVIYAIILYLQKQWTRATTLLTLATSILAGALLFAVLLGGDSVTERFATLFAEDPGLTYQQSRGYMVQQAFQVMLFKYPIGAGLGRWGTMRMYFGDETNLASPSIWAEIQWPAWILDGGIILMVLYTIALVVSTMYEWRIARRHRNPDVRSIAALVLATNLGTVALLFSYVPFCAPIGVQYWFLAGAVSGIASKIQYTRPSKKIGMPSTSQNF